MSNNPNTIDYSGVTKSLSTRRHVDNIRTNVCKVIGDAFLESNGFASRKKASTKTDKLDQFAKNIEGASEWMKTEFILTIDYLSRNNLIKVGKIKSLRLSELGDNSKTTDKKLENILNELTKDLSQNDMSKLDKYIHGRQINLSDEIRKADEIGNRNKELERENAYLHNQNDAMSARHDILQEGCISRRSLSGMRRKLNAIKSIKRSNELSNSDKTRLILWQADKFVAWGHSKTKTIFKRFKRMDINTKYFDVTKKLKDSLKSAKPDEADIIVSIIDEVNQAQKNYSNEISEEMRNANMDDANRYILNAAA